MVRPKAAVDRPKVCPQGHKDGSVYLHGERVGRDSRYGRTRFQCVRGVGKNALRHYWTAPHRAPTTNHPDGTLCTNCEHELVRGEGPSVVPSFEFAVAEIARELVLVGEGTSLRESSQKLRMLGGRYRIDSHGRSDASRDYALAADYLDNFGPIVVRGMTPVRWPRILVLDSQPLGIRVRDAHLYGYVRNRRGGAVLIAAGRERNQARTRCWLATLTGDDTAESWFDFLSQLDSDRPPFWVVADGSKAIRNAVEALWPKAHFYPCEHHLRENALEHARSDGALGEPGIEEAIKQALYGTEAWGPPGHARPGTRPIAALAVVAAPRPRGAPDARHQAPLRRLPERQRTGRAGRARDQGRCRRAQACVPERGAARDSHRAHGDRHRRAGERVALRARASRRAREDGLDPRALVGGAARLRG